MSDTSTELKLKGNWSEVKGKLKKKYGFLTDDDMKVEEGRADELVGKIQQKTGETKSKVIEYIESL